MLRGVEPHPKMCTNVKVSSMLNAFTVYGDCGNVRNDTNWKITTRNITFLVEDIDWNWSYYFYFFLLRCFWFFFFFVLFMIAYVRVSLFAVGVCSRSCWIDANDLVLFWRASTIVDDFWWVSASGERSIEWNFEKRNTNFPIVLKNLMNSGVFNFTRGLFLFFVFLVERKSPKMWLVYIYVGILLFSETEPYWNFKSNQIVEYYPWYQVNCKLCNYQNKTKLIEKWIVRCKQQKEVKELSLSSIKLCVRVVSASMSFAVYTVQCTLSD